VVASFSLSIEKVAEARRMPSNIARLPELLGKGERDQAGGNITGRAPLAPSAWF
jgi:hypothetical protein